MSRPPHQRVFGEVTDHQVFAVAPVLRPAPLNDLAFRVWERYGFNELYDDPQALAPRVKRHLRHLEAAGRLLHSPEGWRRA